MEQCVTAKVMRRLIPFMIFLFILNYLDRVNIGFAQLEWKTSLDFTAAIYGFGASIFYVGYCLFEIPSNLMLEKVGARIWIARIMISWGLVTVGMMFIQGPQSFYLFRVLLGVAEAGFFPGMILYLTYWVPAKERGQAVAWFLTSTALSGVVGGPLASAITGLGGVWDLAGWQWLFLIEGTFTVIVGFLVLVVLTDRPKDAKWLTPEERAWLIERLEQERQAQQQRAHADLGPALKSAKVWMLSSVAFLIMFGFYGIQYWTTELIKSISTISDRWVAMISAIPFLAGAIAMVIVAKQSDRTGERQRYVTIYAFIGAAGFAIVCLSNSIYLTVLGLSVAAVGVFGTMGPFWALPATFLQGTAAAAGIALINSIGNLGSGLLGPNIMGKLKVMTDSYVPGVAVFATALFGAACLSVFIQTRPPSATSAPTTADQPVSVATGTS